MKGVLLFAVFPHFVMKVRTGSAAGEADPAYHLASFYPLPLLDQDPVQVTVNGHIAIAVVDLNHLSVAGLSAGENYQAIRRGFHRGTEGRRDI